MKIRIKQADKVIDGQVVPVLVMTGPPDDVGQITLDQGWGFMVHP